MHDYYNYEQDRRRYEDVSKNVIHAQKALRDGEAEMVRVMAVGDVVLEGDWLRQNVDRISVLSSNKTGTTIVEERVLISDVIAISTMSLPRASDQIPPVRLAKEIKAAIVEEIGHRNGKPEIEAVLPEDLHRHAAVIMRFGDESSDQRDYIADRTLEALSVLISGPTKPEDTPLLATLSRLKTVDNYKAMMKGEDETPLGKALAAIPKEHLTSQMRMLMTDDVQKPFMMSDLPEEACKLMTGRAQIEKITQYATGRFEPYMSRSELVSIVRSEMPKDEQPN